MYVVENVGDSHKRDCLYQKSKCINLGNTVISFSLKEFH